MAKVNSILILSLIITYSYGQSHIYRIDEYFMGGMNISLLVPINEDISGWTLTLSFDEPIKLTAYTGKIDSSKEQLVFVIRNDSKTSYVSKSTVLEIHLQIENDQNAGSNLMKATFNEKDLDIGPIPYHIPVNITSIGSTGKYDYNKVLHASLLFYEAQRCGKLPANNRIKWRRDSFLDDRGENGEDLTGGYFDAGDHVKFGFPQAATIAIMAWGILDYESGYSGAGEMQNAYDALKWGTDYLLKCHVSERVFYGQVGNGLEDHYYWGRPEDWPKGPRPAYKVTNDKPGSDLLGETAAALASSSMVFRKVDQKYSDKLLTHAKQLYDFANEKRDFYVNSITDAKDFYGGNPDYGDELGWAAAWLLRATNDNKYKTDFEKHWKEFDLGRVPTYLTNREKRPALQVLMARTTGDAFYKDVVKRNCDWFLANGTYTPKGLLYLAEWGSLRHVTNSALIFLQAADVGINSTVYRQFAKNQIGYVLGDSGRSFVVGIGVNPPQSPHHRASSCPLPPAGCDSTALSSKKPSPQVLIGALVGGPDVNDYYNDDREDYVHNEVAIDYQSGFQSAVAGLAHLKNINAFT